MTDSTATPEPIRRDRPVKYPAHLAVMLPAELKAAIVNAAAVAGESQGDVVRRWLELGRELDGLDDVLDRAEVRRLAAESPDDLSFVDALAVLVDFSLKEIKRREGRNAKLAVGIARDFAETTGIMPDGIDVGNVSISLDR